MKIAKTYTVAEFLLWTRRKIFILLLLTLVPVVLHQLLGQTWIAAPWAVAVVLGTATSFILGFKNVQTYNRMLEALQIWTAIGATSRYWGLISRDCPIPPESSKILIYRHLAWLAALRYQLRGGDSRPWENAATRSNAEYRAKHYSVPETETTLDAELQKYLPDSEIKQLAAMENKAGGLLSLQSETIRDLYTRQVIPGLYHTEMLKVLKELLDQQSKVERIKNFPYPRQYAAINTMFVWCFVGLLPICLLREFDRLNDGVSGIFQGNMVWLVVPFSVLISWIYLSLDQVGESTENPFEGSANDVPMAQISRTVEIELREMLRETEIPPPLRPKNEIIL